MKPVNVKGIIFTYSSLRMVESNISILKSTVSNILNTKKIILVILNNSDKYSYKEIASELQLLKREKIVIGTINNFETSIFDIENDDISYFENIKTELAFTELILKNYKLNKNNIITIGDSFTHFQLKSSSLIHFHVGKMEYIKQKESNIIPMYEQYELGVNNILEYFLKRNFQDNAIDYSDLIEYINNSTIFYNKNDAPKYILEKHIQVCSYIQQNFPNDVEIIFGTGYPFYALNNKLPINSVRTPKSIIGFLRNQSAFYKNKVLSKITYNNNKDKAYLFNELKNKLQIEIENNPLDIYLYEKEKIKFEQINSKNKLLKEYFASGFFDIDSDIWPCFYCSTLQVDNEFSNVNILKNTNKTCLSCKQTTFKLRNISYFTADIDVIVVVKSNKKEFARKIKDFILKDKTYYIFDSDFYRMIKKANDGPIDLFVTEKKDFMDSLDKLLSKHWLDATFPAIAIWSPLLKIDFNLGKDFPLTFEPRTVINKKLYDRFLQIRKQFAIKNDTQEIIQKLHCDYPREQLLSNKEIVDNLISKMTNWKNLKITDETKY